MKAGIEEVWGNYSKSTRVFDSFSNQWDLCLTLHPTSIPDGDDREDDNDIMPPLPTTSPSQVPPPAPSSFANDIYKYFGSDISLSSRHTDIEGFVPVLHYHFGYQSTTPTSAPSAISFLPVSDWINTVKWDQLCKLLGNSMGEMGSITEPQRQCIMKFIACLINLKASDLNAIPPDLWDLGPLLSLQIPHAHIRVSHAQLSQCRYFIIEPREFPNYVVWTLAVLNPTTAVMCLRRNWGSDMKQIALTLLKSGIAFRTLQQMAVLRHEFMNCPQAQAAFLHGGLIWWLALHSLGFNHLPSVLEGISTEAVPFGDLLVGGGGQTYYDDGLSEEEINFMCGMYYIDLRDGLEMVSWWPRPNAWNVSGLNISFWSARCEDWFQV
ncbi:hypothetical protein EDB19DRAFT_1918789 [Suillus lakei]|nr:hypothetical protein EDB19DRAFT_1918789 [Suillus lakei]